MKKIENKGDLYGQMTEEQQKAGYIKFNIQDKTDPYSLNGEGVWGWVSPEDKEKYNDDNYTGNITAILLNVPFSCDLSWGDEVVLKCNGENRPTLDPVWMAEHLGG